jgi:hypothetical protein
VVLDRHMVRQTLWAKKVDARVTTMRPTYANEGATGEPKAEGTSGRSVGCCKRKAAAGQISSGALTPARVGHAQGSLGAPACALFFGQSRGALFKFSEVQNREDLFDPIEI